MKKMFSQKLKSRFSCGKLLLLVLLMLTSLESYAGGGGGSSNDGWTGSFSVHVGVIQNSTGNGSVYVSTSATATSGEQDYSGEISNTNDQVALYLFAKPSGGFTFAGWYKDEAGNDPVPFENPATGNGDMVSFKGTAENKEIITVIINYTDKEEQLDLK